MSKDLRQTIIFGGEILEIIRRKQEESLRLTGKKKSVKEVICDAIIKAEGLR